MTQDFQDLLQEYTAASATVKEAEHEPTREEENEEDYSNDNDYDQGEIDLTHDEVWDDSALIEAWDAAVKQYETFHSKHGNTKDTATKSKKKKQEEQAVPSVPPKRAKATLNNGAPSNTADSRKSPESEQKAEHLPINGDSASSFTEYTIMERKPSFKKVDKPAFEHFTRPGQPPNQRQQQQQKRGETRSAANSVKGNTNGRPKATPHLAKNGSSMTERAPTLTPMDAATIAYYESLGYYYDPNFTSYETSQEDDGEQLLQPEMEQEHAHSGEQEDMADGVEDENENEQPQEHSGHARPWGSTRPSSKNRASAAPAAVPAVAATQLYPTYPYGTPSSQPFAHNPYHHHYHPSSYPPHAPGFGFHSAYGPQLPMQPSSTVNTAKGASKKGKSKGPATAASRPTMFPGQTGQGHPFPPPHPFMMPMSPMAMPGGMGPMPSHPHLPHLAHQSFAQPTGPTSAGLDNEALSNLIMAWYFSGYYTGLYQAQRR